MGWGKNIGVCFKCEWSLAGILEGGVIYVFLYGIKNFFSCYGENRDIFFFLDNRLGGIVLKYFMVIFEWWKFCFYF